ncbi:MAG: lytic transglycosylase domain-containing protein [Lachnospiraceae bacterium]|nr:lytic transglycosylase domain-containing protein [Lachnospiraceae bacterium]
MTHTEFSAKALTILVAFLITFDILGLCANAYFESTAYPKDEPSVYDLWSIPCEDVQLHKVENYLINNGWVKDGIDKDDLDYICCMANQLSQFYDDISPGLVMAMIAVESRFDKDCLSSAGARGLMQLIPSYHEDRLIQFLDNDSRYSRDLFYEPRLSIMTGMDYLHERLAEAETNLPYALMQYNQGPSSAYKSYVKKGITSNYTTEIIELSVELDGILAS